MLQKEAERGWGCWACTSAWGRCNGSLQREDKKQYSARAPRMREITNVYTAKIELLRCVMMECASDFEVPLYTACSRHIEYCKGVLNEHLGEKNARKQISKLNGRWKTFSSSFWLVSYNSMTLILTVIKLTTWLTEISIFCFSQTCHLSSLCSSNPLNQGSPAFGIKCLMIWGGTNAMIIEIKCTVNIMCLSHPETTPTPIVEKTFFMTSLPDAKNVGDCCKWARLI